MTTPAGSLPLSLAITGSDTKTAAFLDAAALGYADKPLDATIYGDSLHLTLSPDGGPAAMADARVLGDAMRGTVAISGSAYPLLMQRSIKVEKRYTTAEVTLHNGDVALAGTLYLPESNQPVPAVAFVAGLVPRSDSVHFYADQLASRGIAVLTYDRRGVGRSAGEPHASFADHASDAAAAVQYLRGRKEIDATRVGLRGQSQGAWLAPLAATRVPVAFLVLSGGGGVRPFESELYAIPARMRRDSFPEADVAEATRYMQKLFDVGRRGKGWDELSGMMAALRTHPSKWFGKYGPVYVSQERLRKAWEGDFSYDPGPALRSIKVPILALVGEKDDYSPPMENIDALRRLLDTPDKTLKIIPGATHDFHVSGAPLPLVSDEYITTLSEWIAAHAGGASGSALVADHTITSADPPITIEVERSLRFIGSFSMEIRDAAHAERFLFGEADAAGNLRRLWIAQFERMLPQHRGAYDGPKKSDPTRLGPLEFQQTVGFYTFSAAIAAKPGAEAERTRAFLLQKGLHVDGEMVVARFETIIGADRRRELILFYWEDAETADLYRSTIAEASEESRASSFQRFAEHAKTTCTIRGAP